MCNAIMRSLASKGAYYVQSLEIEGEANLASSVQIAQLALKHRQNKNQRQRIVIFIGSPLSEDKVMPPVRRVIGPSGQHLAGDYPAVLPTCLSLQLTRSIFCAGL